MARTLVSGRAIVSGRRIVSGRGTSTPSSVPGVPDPPVLPPLPNPPVISGITQSLLTASGVTVSWTTDQAATGWLKYGTANGGPYPNETIHDVTYTVGKTAAISGLSASTTYYFEVVAENTSAQQTSSTQQSFTTAATPAGVYGSGIQATSKSNIQVRLGASPPRNPIAVRFQASASAPLTSVRWPVRSGTGGYSGGDGGTYSQYLKAVDSSGFPTGAALATVPNYSPGNPGTREIWPVQTFTSAPTLVAGTTYAYVIENVHASQTTNWTSFNSLLVSATSPRAPHFSDDIYGILSYSGSAWSVITDYVATFEAIYGGGAAGTYDGCAYTTPRNKTAGEYILVTDTSWVREQFTVSVPTFSCTKAYLFAGRVSGSGNITIAIKDSGNNTLRSGTAAITSWPTNSAGQDAANGAWVSVTFASLSLTNGSTYSVVVSGVNTGVLDVWPISAYDGSMAPLFRSYKFTDGTFQNSTNSGGSWSTSNSEYDLMFYLA